MDDHLIELILTRLQQLKNTITDLSYAWNYERSKRWKNRKWLRRPFLKNRLTRGFFVTTFADLKSEPDLFFKYTRMDLKTFNYLLSLIKPKMHLHRKRKTNILPEERLAITLRYLSTGDENFSIAVDYRISESTIYDIIKSTATIIRLVLSPVYLSPPNKVTWRNISKGFSNYWNLPNCIGAIDGKQHIAIKAPSNSGSLYFNYKKFYSIVLLAICNHRYEFTCIDVGAYGGESDGGIFARSELGHAFDNKTLNIPEEKPNLSNSDIKTPYYLVGDEAFKMTTNLMRPFPGRHLDNGKRIFNYRLSRARRCIENAFGILVSRWRVFLIPIGFEPQHVKEIVVATVCLHNFLMARTQKEVRQKYYPLDFADSECNTGEVSNAQWRKEVPPSNETTKEAHNMRETLKNYFLTTEGEVSWQNEFIHRGRYLDM